MKQNEVRKTVDMEEKGGLSKHNWKIGKHIEGYGKAHIKSYKKLIQLINLINLAGL